MIEPIKNRDIKMMILNLTKQIASAEQIEAGVVEPSSDLKDVIVDLLTFGELPSPKNIEDRAHDLAQLLDFNNLAIEDDDEDPNFQYALIGGENFLMPALEQAIKALSKKPLYAFLKGDKHIGFIEV